MLKKVLIIFKLLNVQKSVSLLLLFNAGSPFVPIMLVTVISYSGVHVPCQHYVIISFTLFNKFCSIL
jgi:hypothetical protein